MPPTTLPADIEEDIEDVIQRLEELGDEFGELGEAFDEVIADLRELLGRFF